MRKNVQKFTYNGHSIRIVYDQGQPRLVAIDVVRAMGYRRPDATLWYRDVSLQS